MSGELRVRGTSGGGDMGLSVAVQMDPSERINIHGDSTFALLLEAQARGHSLAYYTPERLAMQDGRVFTTVRALEVVDRAGSHFTLGEAPRCSGSRARTPTLARSTTCSPPCSRSRGWCSFICRP